jgi:hypothetical protein
LSLLTLTVEVDKAVVSAMDDLPEARATNYGVDAPAVAAAEQHLAMFMNVGAAPRAAMLPEGGNTAALE